MSFDRTNWTNTWMDAVLALSILLYSYFQTMGMNKLRFFHMHQRH